MRIVFTPLFLGAQLLVPSRSDIAHERLAEWMAKYSPTVTHLTPASMLRQLHDMYMDANIT
jgi:L-aminoadipate-semialdehyde dehydrogenase